MGHTASLVRGIPATAAGTLRSAELSIPSDKRSAQLQRQPTETTDRQTLLYSSRFNDPSIQKLFGGVRTNPAKQVPTTSKLDQSPKMKSPGDESELVPQKPGDLQIYQSEKMGATQRDKTPKIAPYHHCPPV
ncbi:hypothetical protein BJV74DRAFT_561850 [Russula compacta]|nr:hypothetical protein BJV74DRAFT_561850 [Russula compacta]